MSTDIPHFQTIVAIIEAGARGDHDKVVERAQWLADRLEAEGDILNADYLRRRLATLSSPGMTGGFAPITMASAATTVAELVTEESHLALLEEIAVSQAPSPILDDHTAAEIERFISFQKEAEALRRQHLPIPHSLVLHGPPGCGKTVIATHIARRLSLPLFSVRLDTILSSDTHLLERLRDVFDAAILRRGVILLRHLDMFMTTDTGEINRIMNSLIYHMRLYPRVCVIATLNHAIPADRSMWRNFDAVIAVTLPERAERQALFRLFLPEIAPDHEGLALLADITPGYSGADIQSVIVRAHQERILAASPSMLQSVMRVIWYQEGGQRMIATPSPDTKAALVAFIDQRGQTKISARAISMLTGIPAPTVAHLRHRIKGVSE